MAFSVDDCVCVCGMCMYLVLCPTCERKDFDICILLLLVVVLSVLLVVISIILFIITILLLLIIIILCSSNVVNDDEEKTTKICFFIIVLLFNELSLFCEILKRDEKFTKDPTWIEICLQFSYSSNNFIALIIEIKLMLSRS